MTLNKNTKNETIKEQLNHQLTEVANNWDISGSVFVLQKNDTLYEKSFGFSDRDKGLQTTSQSRYLLHSESEFFTALSIFLLIDQNRLKLSDKLAKYIPEYPLCGGITIKHLIKSNSGIPDFFYNCLMVAFDQDPEYKALDDIARIPVEKKAYYENSNFQAVLSLIKSLPLEYKPGTKDMTPSQSNSIFLAEIVRRITGGSVFDFLDAHLFSSLHMHSVLQGDCADTVSYAVFRETTLVRLPLDYFVEGLLTVTPEDMKKLLAALCKRELFSEALWSKILKKDSEGNGLLFENANGYDCADVSFLGYGFYCYFNHASGTAFASLVNEDQKMTFSEGTWHYFRRDSREAIDAALTYPLNTKIVKIAKSNFWDALNLKVTKDQAEFVLEAKSSVAMGLMYKTKKTFVQMEGNTCVGLLVLDINPKKDYYHIDIILIDKRYQGRGYGKHMLKFAVEALKAAGAKSLKIGVNRFNYGAQKIYMDAGFTPKSIYEEGMELHMNL